MSSIDSLIDQVKKAEVERIKMDDNNKITPEYIQHFLKEAILKHDDSTEHRERFKESFAKEYAGIFSSDQELQEKAALVFNFPVRSRGTGNNPATQQPVEPSPLVKPDMFSERWNKASGRQYGQPAESGSMHAERWKH